MSKLTKAQQECLEIMGRDGRMRASDSYRPTQALVRLRLARRLMPNGFGGTPSFEITEAGRALLAAREPKP